MTEINAKVRNSVARQADMFRLADARHDLNRATLSTLTGISTSTLKGWANDTVMPAWALGALGEAGVPDDLLSLVLSPFTRAVLTTDGDDDALDELACETSGFAADYIAAKADGVVTPIERAKLKERAGRVKAVARRAA